MIGAMESPAMSEYEIVGARGKVHGPSHLLDRLQAVQGGQVLALDAGMVCGREHLESAVEHALRAFTRGTNSANNIMMETMLYASGERQISKAREKMSVKEGVDGIALILFGASKDDVLKITGLEEDGAVLECSRSKLIRFGIGSDELDAVPPERTSDLALERVAFVEILKR
jgi:KEOPS complex subunit Cgi121